MAIKPATFTHGMADIEPGVRLHHVTAGDGPRTIVLVHGFPQTWREWRHVIPLLVHAGFRVVAPDYRGAGHSSRPVGGYDKRTMAGDIRALVREHLGIADDVVMVGHDIGMMVAYAYAERYRDEVSHLVTVDATLPGTGPFHRLAWDPRAWHLGFNRARDVAEALVAGRERQYIQAFINARLFDPTGMTDEDLDAYASVFSSPGGMRAGFELYRAFDQDVADNLQAREQRGKLTVPVLAVGGQMSPPGEVVAELMGEVAENVTGVRIPRTGHWIPEENPTALVDALLEFLA